MRVARNIGIIALLALPVAFVPGGGDVARAVITALVMAFLATIALGGYQLYRQNALTITTLPDGRRAVLFGAVGVIVLMIAGADELLASGGGTLVWIGLLALSAFAIFRIWTEAHTY
jgi:hypothetical protein